MTTSEQSFSHTTPGVTIYHLEMGKGPVVTTSSPLLAPRVQSHLMLRKASKTDPLVELQHCLDRRWQQLMG